MIAAIHGACIGGATNMVTFADIRYCTNDSYFQVKEAALGKKGKTHTVIIWFINAEKYAISNFAFQSF